MAHRTLRGVRARVVALLLLFLLPGIATGCGDLLEVSDPTTILERDVNDAEGAQLLRRGVLRLLYEQGWGSAYESGLLGDEFWFQIPAFNQQFGIPHSDDLLDRRNSEEYNSRFDNSRYLSWQQLWGGSTAMALAKLRDYAPPGARGAHVGEMLAVRGFAALRLAEHYCPGFPLHQVVDGSRVYGPPVSTEQVFEAALAAFDSAVTWAADSARVLDFARVGRARTLLNLGRFAEAASAVVDVPTGYVYQTEQSSALGLSNFLHAGAWGGTRSVADREGGIGLNFVAANDPRVPTRSVGTARDGSTVMYALTKYPNANAPIVLASGIEARLIEAEAALRTNPNLPQWLTILNALRTDGSQDSSGTYRPGTGGVAGLAPLADPGTEAARVDLLFRERAFWLFATGSRLGDLRRLVRVYGRQRESVFPTGGYWRTGLYGTGTSIPFHKDEVRSSPGVTGCTSW